MALERGRVWRETVAPSLVSRVTYSGEALCPEDRQAALRTGPWGEDSRPAPAGQPLPRGCSSPDEGLPFPRPAAKVSPVPHPQPLREIIHDNVCFIAARFGVTFCTAVGHKYVSSHS